MTIEAIHLTNSQLNVIYLASEEAYPSEACGLVTGWLLGEGTLKAARVVRAKNLLANSTDDKFEVDPRTRIEVEKRIRGTDERLIGHYHSHPNKPAYPSKLDLQKAYEPNLVWIIVSLVEGKVTDITAHKVHESGLGFKKISFLVS